MENFIFMFSNIKPLSINLLNFIKFQNSRGRNLLYIQVCYFYEDVSI